MSFTDFTDALPDFVAAPVSDLGTLTPDAISSGSSLSDIFNTGANAAGIPTSGFSLNTVLPPAPSITSFSPSAVITDISGTLTNFFKGEQQVYSAQAAANLTKAQGTAAVKNAANPTAGIPSAYFLIGAALLAAVVITKK